jgi:hypothetical protein
LSVNPSSRDVTSGAQTYSLTGSNLSANVIVSMNGGTTAGAFQASSNGTNYFSTVTLTPSSGSVSQTMFVRKNPQLALFGGVHTTTCVNASTGATSQNVSLSYTEPGE